MLPRPLRGIVPPMVTPLHDRDSLDVSGLERVVARLIEGGVNGLFILGTTGEGPSLSYKLRRELVDRVCGLAGGRVPVLVGVADTSVVESIRLAEHAASRGADGVVMTPPYYFRLDQDEFLSFLERVSGEFPLPVFLYNLPKHVGFSIAPETARRAADLPNVWGVKDSSGDLGYFETLVRALQDKPEFSVLNGPEQLLAATVSLGGHGGVCGGANLYPSLYVRLYEAARRRDRAEADRLHQLVMEICDRIYTLGPESSAYLRGLKCALALQGICSGVLAEPYSAFSEPERKRIGEELAAIEEKLGQPVQAL